MKDGPLWGFFSKNDYLFHLYSKCHSRCLFTFFVIHPSIGSCKLKCEINILKKIDKYSTASETQINSVNPAFASKSLTASIQHLVNITFSDRLLQLPISLKMTISASSCHFGAQYESDGPWVCCLGLTLHVTVHLKEDSNRNSAHFHATRDIFCPAVLFNPKICLSIHLSILVTIEVRHGHYLPNQKGEWTLMNTEGIAGMPY